MTGDASRDLRHAVRSLSRAPGFALAAVVSIAIGIGANTAMFSVAHAVLVRPLPYADPDRLVILWNRSPGLGITEDWFSTAQYFDIRRAGTSFEQVALAIGGNDNLTGNGEPERLGTIRVSSNLLPMLGVRPALGRLFVPAEDVQGAPPTAILGHGTWTRRYGADSRVIGRRLIINGQPYSIVGVLPATFSLPREVMPTLDGAEDAEVVLPLPLAAAAADVRTREDYNVLARLRPGVTIAQAQAEMDVLTARLRRDHPAVYPPNGGLTFSIVPLQEQVVGDVRQAVLVLVAAVGCVLLVACANVANLLLARAVGREREFAVRQAIGAGRARLARQLLTESTLLGAVGGAAGLMLAAGLVAGLRRFGSGTVPRLQEVGIDATVLAFTAALSIASGVVFGLVPAFRVGRADLHGLLQEGARGASGAGSVWGRGTGARRLLVGAELAVSVVLLVSAGLLLRSFLRVQGVDPGFTSSGVLTLELTMSGRAYGDPEKVLTAYRELWRRLDALPEVTAAGGVSALPLSRMYSWGPITVEGRTPPPGEAFINADQRIVAGRYFEAMRIRLVRGRSFDAHDTRAAPRVTVVDTRMARELWPGEDAIGKRLRLGGPTSKTPWVTVIGVVNRIKQYALDDDPRMAMYLAHEQFPGRAMNVAIRTTEDPAAVAPSVRRVLASIDPDLPMYKVRTMDARVMDSLAVRRFAMLLLAAFSAVALGLAVVGISGVMSYVVNQGRRDLGIRLALGATPSDVVLLVLRQGGLVVAAGLAIGLSASLVVTRSLRGLLFGVEPADPVTLAGTLILLGVAALVASYVPARRAARIDPLVSLRSE